MNKILITGGNGQLGNELKNILLSASFINLYHTVFTDISELDITDINAVRKFIKNKDIEIIVNCAAYTAVDSAEQNYDTANKVNNIAVKNLATIAKENNLKFVHISTDYVFDGANNKPYIETDNTNPQSVYGKTKLEGELALLNINPDNTIIIRTSWVYSIYGNNFVKTMLKLIKEREELNIVSDQIGTPTSAKDLASTIVNILPKLSNNDVEIYHYSNEGVASWYDFTLEIKSLLDKYLKTNCLINPISSIDYPTPAARPYYSILSKKKIKKEFNIQIPHWKTSLSKVLDKLILETNKIKTEEQNA